MTKEKIPSDLYEALRNAGFQLETQLNEYIHKYMNQKEFAAAASVFKKAHGRLMDLLQEFHETASPHIKSPTKQDVANIAQLVVQVEEKVDVLSDQVAELTETIKKLNSGTPDKKEQTEPSAESPEETAAWDTLKEARRKRLQAMSEAAKSSIESKLGTLSASEKLKGTNFSQLIEMLQGMKKSE
ncbi:hypothetical protein FZC79_13905 [Rossellomorea vietnamensis]|uniref:Uncharacterized protein n=2 Tax=Rossellomorea TaxID=2837508 RepID=A0A5D4KC89_9BACI|nr:MULTISPECIES: hypothetical protein [Rossellomorea]TYR74566.1 hypothetical protein FZC79_13905 [Rossellomorea vietnamensis]TYS75127.1 hypothetical protein FZC80_18300 [Rossellomorea aquimaris]